MPKKHLTTPIHHRGTNGYGVLLLHGFTSTPVIFDELAAALHDLGYSVHAPLIAGHGTNPEDLETTSWRDWLVSAQEAYDHLAQETDKIFIIGASFGCNLASFLAAEHQVQGLILIGFPRWLTHHTGIRLLYEYYRLFGIRYFSKKVDAEEENTMFSTDTGAYLKIPVKSMGHFFFLTGKATDKALRSITAPTLIIQSANDGLVAGKSAKHVMKLLASMHKQLVWVDEPHHRLHLGKSKYQIFSYINGFLTRWRE